MNTKSNTSTKSLGVLAVIAALAMAVVPFTAFAAEQTGTTTVTSTIGSAISMTGAAATVNISATPGATAVQTTASHDVVVATNSTAGYTLKLNTSTAATALTKGSDTIAAASGTFAAPAALTANSWGYRVDNVGTFGAGPTAELSSQPVGAITYAGVPVSASAAVLKSTEAATAGDTTKVWYSLAVDSTVPTGTYTNTVVYTATSK